MGVATKYWQLVKIDGAAGVVTKDITPAQMFFVQVFGVSNDVNGDDVQRQLLQLYGNGVKCAELCLRCFISWIIVQVCQNLAIKFGTQHNFSCSDLLPYVLDDNDNKSSLVDFYQPFSLQILQSYNSQRGSLTTWVSNFRGACIRCITAEYKTLRQRPQRNIKRSSTVLLGIDL